MHYTSQFMGLWRNVPCYLPVSMGLWCSRLPCFTLPPPVCVSSLIWLSPARRCYTTSGFAHTHTHTHTEKKVIKRHKKIWQFIWWQKKTISRRMQWLSISKRSKFKDQGRGPSHPRSPFVPSNRYSQICTVCLCLVSLPCLCIGSVYDMMICLFWFCFFFFFLSSYILSTRCFFIYCFSTT